MDDVASATSETSPLSPGFASRLRAGLIFRAAIMAQRLRARMRREAEEGGLARHSEASSHSYLPGEEMDVSIGDAHVDASQSAEMLLPLHRTSGVVLFPHESLPIRLPMHIPLASLLKARLDSMDNEAYFGSISFGGYGTVATVNSIIRAPIGSSLSEEEFIAKAVGMCRFEVVRILKPDDDENYHYNESYRRRFPTAMWAVVRLVPDALPPALNPDLFMKSPLPAHLLRGRDVRSVLARMHDHCLSSASFPRCPLRGADPVFFSWWLAANLPLTRTQRLSVLKMPTIHERCAALQFFLVDADRELLCRGCDCRLARRTDVFSVPGASGVSSAYVNPHGVIHQTVTVRKVENVVVEMTLPTLEDTWFPGYAWQITYCKTCGCHLGWKFSLVRGLVRDEHGLVDHFYGFRDSALTTRGQVTADQSGVSSDANGDIDSDEEEIPRIFIP